MAEPTITVGNVSITSLTDLRGDFPLSQVFPAIPAQAWGPYRQRFPEFFSGENWRNHLGCYVIRSQGKTILVDTGIGPGPIDFLGGARGGLMEDLRAKGVRPEEIDIVFFTHLHFDHVGWNLTSEGRPTFPKARYMIHQADWDAFHQPSPQPYISQSVTPLRELGVLDLLSGERALTDEVTAFHTPGHTPGHMSLLVSSGGEKAIVTGDVLHHPAQVTESEWQTSFDSDDQTAIQTRKRILDRLESEGMRAAVNHFLPPGFGKVVRVEGRRYWQAL